MLILPDYVYKWETEVCWRFDTAHLLPALRIGVVIDGSSQLNKIHAAGPYQLVAGFMKVSGGGERRYHRILYVQTNAEPWKDDGSDNWVLPSSFKPREPMTERPETFDPGLGTLGPMRHAWTKLIASVKARWDRHYQNLGILPPSQSRDRWGETYASPF